MNSWNITLPQKLAGFVREQLATKAWESPDILFASAIATLQSDVTLVDFLDQDWLRAELQMGIDQLDRGEWVDGEEAFERLHKKLDVAIQKEADEADRGKLLDEHEVSDTILVELRESAQKSV